MRKIIQADIADANTIARLVNSAYRGDSSRKGWTTEADLLDGTRTHAEAIVALIKKEGTTVLKCVDDDQIVGCVELEKSGDQMYLGMLSVQPDLQASGIGKDLLKAGEDHARRQKCVRVVMTVISIRSELIAWYERHGYTDTGERKPFHFNDPQFGIPKKSLEFIVMEKRLN
jgi:ribosomal protein S18 acetylase RimI-like enzyme